MVFSFTTYYNKLSTDSAVEKFHNRIDASVVMSTFCVDITGLEPTF